MDQGKNLKGEEWWTTYRFQLEALVDRVRGRETDTWLTKEESVVVMGWEVGQSRVTECHEFVVLTPSSCSL